jgi:hypothetical protein
VYGNACCGLLKELFEEAKSLELWEVTLQHKMYLILDSIKKILVNVLRTVDMAETANAPSKSAGP